MFDLIKQAYYLSLRLILFSCMTLLFMTTLVIGDDLLTAENYCVKCHEPHAGLDLEVYTCMTCHEAVPMGYMALYPWYTSEAAIAGIRCNDCHKLECQGSSCLSCHQRHSDPLR